MSRRNDFFRNVDWITFSLYISLVAIGWLMIYAVGYDEDHPASLFNLDTNAGKQLLFIGISFGVLLVTAIIDWKFWRTFAYPIFAIGLIQLGAVLILGVTIKGATSWYRFGGFTYQPSEFAKFATAVAIAAFLSQYNTTLKNWRSVATVFGIMLLPMVLILLQPDAGSALVFTSFLIVLYRAGLSSTIYIFGFATSILLVLGLVYDPRIIIVGLILIILLVFATNFKEKFRLIIGLSAWTIISSAFLYFGVVYPILGINLLALILGSYFLYNQRKMQLVGQLLSLFVIGSALSFSSNYAFNNVLERHQRDRINVWLRPSMCDPQGALYNVLQSKMTIGSGGLEGKGFLEGTMTKLNYVPEQSTDFIFCTIGEEQGFIGTVGIVGLFFLLLMRVVMIAERQRSDFSKYYAYCVAGILFIHVFINIGMTMGLVPIIGIPLPFISYGGSSILGFSLLIGVLLKLDSNRLVG